MSVQTFRLQKLASPAPAPFFFEISPFFSLLPPYQYSHAPPALSCTTFRTSKPHLLFSRPSLHNAGETINGASTNFPVKNGLSTQSKSFYLTNKQTLAVLYSVVKHAGSGQRTKRVQSVGGNTRRSRVFLHILLECSSRCLRLVAFLTIIASLVLTFMFALQTDQVIIKMEVNSSFENFAQSCQN